MSVIIGSARIDENGHAHGGAAGDQKQTSTPDYRGEVSMQEFYMHSKGWIVARLIDDAAAVKNAQSMETACNNKNIGYDQYQRDGIWTAGTATKKKTECDCSSLVRRCLYEATGKDVGNIRTILMERMLKESGLFQELKQYKSGMKLCTGDVLFTGQLGHPVSGHTVIVVKGESRGKEPLRAAVPTLRRGMKNNSEVEMLQRDLRHLKYVGEDKAKLSIDKDFGPNTEYAVKQFQKDAKKEGTYDSEIDGIYGPKSASAMKKALK